MAKSLKMKASLCGTGCFSTRGNRSQADRQVSTTVSKEQAGFYQTICTTFQFAHSKALSTCYNTF